MRSARSLLTAAVAAVLVTGCGGDAVPGGGPSHTDPGSAGTTVPSSSPPTTTQEESVTTAPSAPRRLSPADDGRTYSMTVGQGSDLTIQDPLAADPVVEGQSVELVELHNITASGAREWELRAVAPGTTVLTWADPSFTLTIEVLAGD